MMIGHIDYEQLAKKAAVNWQRWSSVAWFAEPADSENWTIVYTSNRDSGPLDRANAKAIAAALEPFTDDGEEEGSADVVSESHNHWAVGHVDGYSIRVYRDGNVTPAFQAWVDLQARMDDYPVLDDDLYSQEQQEESEEGWENWARRDFQRELEKLFDVELDWVADPPGDVGEWVEQPAELFATGKPRSVYVYKVPDSESAFRGLFDELCERSNTYWEEESSGMYIRLSRVANAAEWEDVRPFVIDAELYTEEEGD